MVRAALLVVEQWGDWIGLGLALVIGLAPLFAGVPENQALVLNSALVGMSVWGCP